MTTPYSLIQVEDENYIFELEELEQIHSIFNSEPNITLSDLKHLFQGKPVIDVTDGEYIHWIQLDQEAINFVKQLTYKLAESKIGLCD